MSRPSASFSTWLGDQPVDAGPALGELGEIGFERPREDVAAFGEFLDLAVDQPVDAGPALGQLGEIGLERAGGCRGLRRASRPGRRPCRRCWSGSRTAWRDRPPAHARGCCGLRPACRHGRRPFRQCSIGFGRASARSSLSARARFSRPAVEPVELAFQCRVDAGARFVDLAQVVLEGRDDQGAAFRQFLDLLADGAPRSRNGLRRISADRPAVPPPCGRGLRPACGVWFSTA